MIKWTEETITLELKQIAKKLGEFPTATQLRKLKRTDIINAIQRSGKSFHHFRDNLGYEYNRQPEGYWDQYFMKELESTAKELGHFPTQQELFKLGKSGIHHAMQRAGISVNECRQKLGYDIQERNKCYWSNWDNLVAELQPFIKNNEFPTISTINQKIGGGCIRAIRNFGGVATVAKKLGCQVSRFHTASDGHYVHSANEYLFDEFLYSRGIQHEVDGIIDPSDKRRYDFKINDIYSEIWGFNSSRNYKLQKQYAIKRKKKEQLYSHLHLQLVSIEYDVFEQPLKDIEQYFIHLLSGLGFDTSVKDPKYRIENIINHYEVWNEEKVLLELKKIIKEIGHFPTHQELIDIQRCDVLGAMNKYGGSQHFANKLGYTCRKPSGYWTDEKILNALQHITSQLNHFPTRSELKKLNKEDLIWAIYDHGNFQKFKSLI